MGRSRFDAREVGLHNLPITRNPKEQCLVVVDAFADQLLDDGQSSRPFFYAVLTSSALLYILNRRRAEFPLDALRVLADVAMLVPLLVFLAAAGE